MLVPGPQGSNQGYVQVSYFEIEQARVVPEFGEQSRLTVLSYDLVDSTSILATSDLEDYQDLIAAFQRMACGAVANAGGSSPEIAGDGGMTFFGSRADAQDAATSAIETALQIVEGCRLLSQERARNDLHVRIGIATSKVVVERGNRRSDLAKVTGLAPAMATRLQALAQPDTVLVSQEARDLARRSHVFRFLGKRSLKGFAKTEGVWQALRHRLAVDRFFAFGSVSNETVGREAELQIAMRAWQKAVAGNGSVLVIEGEAGIGKSRLLREIRKTTRKERSRMLLLQCSPSGMRTTLHPLLNDILKLALGSGRSLDLDIVRSLFLRQGIEDDDAIGIFSFLLGVGGPIAERLKHEPADKIREKAQWAARRCLELFATRGPLVLAVEDVHWIDHTSGEILKWVAESVGDLPVLIIVTSRVPWPGLWKKDTNIERIRLHGLKYDDTRDVMGALLRTDHAEIPPDSVELVHQMTGGIPLFIEEFCRWKSEGIPRIGKKPAGAALGAEIATFENILSSRIESINFATEITSGAAVIGRQFALGLLERVLPGLNQHIIQDVLGALCDAGIIVRSRIPGTLTFAFRHSLFQETIYNATLRKSRREFHKRIFSAVANSNSLAPWMGAAELAEHAEHAEQFEDAVPLHVAAGQTSFALSAMVEARQLLDHALELVGNMPDSDARDVLKLTSISAIGPVLTSMEGSTSPQACKLYEEGVGIARRRPAAEQAKWFPIYWGWWFTGSDFSVQRQRAQAAISDLGSIADAEVQLQVRHCLWAIEFNVGHHDSCIEAVNAGLEIYQAGHGAESLTLYGGHDARVCGLGQRGLSLWFAGHVADALRSVDESRKWADRLGHVGSIAHACDIQAMLHRYRRDFQSLRAIALDMKSIAALHNIPSLSAKAELFEGWCIGLTENPQIGLDMVERGMAVLWKIETPEDFPVYCDMHAELLALRGEVEQGLQLVTKTIAEAERTGHAYWLAELHHRLARLMHASDMNREAIALALDRSLGIALAQNSISSLLSAYETLHTLKVSPELEGKYKSDVERALNKISFRTRAVRRDGASAEYLSGSSECT
jgi:predicted ATPase/class 3 adenylate cyclase